MRRIIFLGIVLLGAGNLWGQDGAWESNIAANYTLGTWRFNTSVGHRSLAETEGTRLAFLEVNQFISRRVTPELTLSLGYKYRDPHESDNIENRLTQQFAYTHLNEKVRLVSRLRLEQRFRDDFEHRYRYRFSLDMPLQGQKIDPKELYLLSSNELLLAFSEGETAFDNRFTIGTGYVFSEQCRLQVEITQRFEDINTELSTIPFVHTSLIWNLK